MNWLGLLVKALVSAVLEWARRLHNDALARKTKRDLGRAEQLAATNKEIADASNKAGKTAEEIGTVASRPMSRERNRDRLRNGSA